MRFAWTSQLTFAVFILNLTCAVHQDTGVLLSPDEPNDEMNIKVENISKPDPYFLTASHAQLHNDNERAVL
jgi:hypothetical protein